MALRFFPVLILAALALVNTADASIVVDQDFISSANPDGSGSLTRAGGSFGRAQTFTVGVAGKLDSIEVRLRAGFGYEMRILETSNGRPIGGGSGSNVLASTTQLSSSGDIYRYDFSNADFQVEVGDVLAIELLKVDDDNDDNFFAAWLSVSSGGYGGGGDYFYNTEFNIDNWRGSGFDNLFRTYVEVNPVPEPSTLMVFSLGCVCLCGYRMRRRLKGKSAV